MYLFDGRLVRRWVPLSCTWSKGLPHNHIQEMAGLVRSDEKTEKKTHTPGGFNTMPGFIPY